jgi:hypothetical protein
MAMLLTGCGTISSEFNAISDEFKLGMVEAKDRLEMIGLRPASSQRAARPSPMPPASEANGTNGGAGAKGANGSITSNGAIANNGATTPSEQRMWVRDIQRDLARLGYYLGPLDGLTGSQTRFAVKLYQGDNGFVQDGEISPQLAHHINARLVANGIQSLAQH